ncbi:hypothetical protein ACS0TY_021951 [Phlomoides rotata]
MAAFRVKYDIPISKLFVLCNAEGILRTSTCYTSRSFDSEYIDTLVQKSVVLVHDKKYDGQIKSCHLHSVFWQLCVREASIEKFLHIVNY